MLLEIEEAVFGSSDHPPVFTLLDLVAEERHEWRPTVPVADAAEQFVRENAPNTRALIEMVHKCLVEAASPAPAAGTPVPVPAGQERLLAHDLQHPAVMVVEDAINDGCFVLAVARAFGRERILLAKANKWLVFDNAGGVDRMPEFVAGARGRFHMLGAVRVAALLDSDRQIPRQRTNRYDYADAISAQRCAVHVWERRHVESYLPTAVWLYHFPDRTTKIGMLLGMRPDQWGCLHMKNGLGQGRRPREVERHFAHLPAEVRHEWQTGLRLPSRVQLVPDELPLSEADFAELGEAAVDELREVLAMIERIL